MRQLGKWQILLLASAIVYMFFLVLNALALPMVWDEVNHFNGALLLIRGQIWDYIGFNSYYPPLYNLVTTAYFLVGGASTFVGRLVSITFSLLTIFVTYKIGKLMYSSKVGAAAAILFAVIPGIFMISSVALIETMLLFVFSLSLYYFFKWLQTSVRKDLILSMVAFGAGVAVKYQVLIVAPIIMFVSMLVFGKRDFLKSQTQKFLHSRRIWIAVFILGIAVVLFYAFYSSGLLSVWLSAMQTTNGDPTWYSNPVFTPIFYLINLVMPYWNQRPISFLFYGLSLAGLVFFAFRRKPQDKYLLVWFLATYAIFTLIPNRQWRYVSLMFPVLAIAAAEVTASIYNRAQKVWQSTKTSVNRKRLAKFSAVILLVFVVSGVFVSSMDAYVWSLNDQDIVPIEPAADYIRTHPLKDQSVIVIFTYNLFSRDMAWFYLNRQSSFDMPVYHYPDTDAEIRSFNATDFANFCETNRTGYVMLYEFGGNNTYYNSPLTFEHITAMLNDTGRFSLQAEFGQKPYRMFVYGFK
jgi:4-amino-4-deoxy-L-arabinose transferase-like glycosyltransferase